MSRVTRILAITVAACCLAAAAAAQQPADTGAASQDSTLRVFIDCPSMQSGCDADYFRTELTFVDHVRTPEDADVHVLITTQGTGAGGTEYTITFIGRRRFVGRADTLRYVAHQSDTDQERRAGLMHAVKLGLVRYAATTPLASAIEVTYTAPLARGTQVSLHDPWNYWVFSLGGNGFFNGQKSTNAQSVYGNLSASRVTAKSKTLLSLFENYNRNSFTFTQYDTAGTPIGDTTVISISRGYGGDALWVKSLGPHWSAGFEVSAERSTFSNEKLSLAVGPAVEYDIFPYDQSTRRILRILYRVTGNYYSYSDSTIFDLTHETRAKEALTVGLSATQPWGTAFGTLTASNYLHDFSKNNVELFGGIGIRLARGLSFNISGDVSLVHDQLFLPKQGASESEVLLQRRALATNYQYFMSMGLSYYFGSKVNNIVNPRFGRSAGGGNSTVCFSN